MFLYIKTLYKVNVESTSCQRVRKRKLWLNKLSMQFIRSILKRVYICSKSKKRLRVPNVTFCPFYYFEQVSVQQKINEARTKLITPAKSFSKGFLVYSWGITAQKNEVFH